MESFKTLQDTISTALVSTTRSATRISSADIPFQRSLNPEIGTALDAQNARLLHLAQRLLENAAASSDAVGPRLPDAEAIDGNWKGVVDVIDSLLEKADTSLDEYTGVVKRLAPSGDQAAAAAGAPKPRNPMGGSLHIPKPQLKFQHVPKNNETGGFRPLLTSKPYARVPLEECVKAFKDRNGKEQYPHPYQTEIESYNYPSDMYEQSEPQPYTPFETTTATLVDTPEALAAMLSELKTAKEIAIDLEHHDNRSYIGMVSLMQISTREKDWIVDTLKPWRRRLECLNEVFANPNILKVLHGAYMDIIWLQRDLGLYVVGLFDTYHAARALGYPGASLAFLLEKFVQFKAQKQYQMADWRVRPLSDELFTYARADTHFLLYIFDNMRNELIAKSNFSTPEKDKILSVLEKSRETALQRYEHPTYDAELGLGAIGWYKLIMRTPAQFTSQQFSVFRAVHRWRDTVGREEDESPSFVMPNHAVFSVARLLPRDKAALLNVSQHVSPPLRLRANELIAVIAAAKLEDGPELDDTMKKISDLRFAERVAAGTASAPAAGSILKQPLNPAPSLTTLETPPLLRARESRFWGALLDEESGEKQRRLRHTLDINLALPLPPLTAEIFTDNAGIAAQETPKAERPEHTFVPKKDRVPEDQRTDIFVVKQLGGGRKRTLAQATEEESESLAVASQDAAAEACEEQVEADEIGLGEREGTIQKISDAKKRRQQKKAQRERQKATKSSGGSDGEEEAVFDYTTAPTVLRAGDVEREAAHGGKRKKDKKEKKKKDANFNPYAKLTDAPKGLARSQKEGPGRSKTFSS
ncbi:exosome complex exonuclease-like protein Rrp6 [Pleomassaria siparia CBS 279.74]|uniref:Exosome complex exonuclease-like protein Rrp6 n=1 Tax=Pleomassaria siparia CBS 279.74 TaxID=1314801 RepID=A0A6G1KP12_9PLEO|nr:exosome complex exonuclease-like protein Rrp6 [Pleomassaria siparia CBS 279.74]